MFKAFFRLDPRLKADLWKQRRAIVLGLLCTVVTASLTSLTIPVIDRAVRAIQHASPIVVPVGMNPLASEDRFTADVAEEANVDPKQLQQAIDRVKARSDANQEATDAGLARRKKALSDLAWIASVMVLIYGVKYWFTRGTVTFTSMASTALANDLRGRIVDRLMRLPVAFFNEKRAGAIQSVLTNDTNVYLSAVNAMRDSIDSPLKMVTGMVAVFWIQPTLAFISILFFPIIGAIVQLNSRKMRQAQAVVQRDLADLQSFTQEVVLGTRVVKAFGAQERIRGAFSHLIKKYYQSQMRAARRMASLKPLIELVGAAALACIVYLCGWLAFQSKLDIAQVSALVYALDVVNQGWRGMGYVKNTLAQVEAATERIYDEVLEQPIESDQNPDATTLDHLSGRIEFQNVSFSYPDGTEALRDVSFVIEPGEALALVGPSGAGKSTIADLLLRFYDPTSGLVLFDGVDVRTLNVDWLRQQIGVVPQQTFLFAGTVSENIRLGDADATDEEVRLAAMAAHADVFINRLPKRYEETLGEQGVGLSGGERQRVAIARALVRKPTILLLDEATSALDAESERAVTQALDEIMHSRTTLFIAHRLTTAARADRILVLRRGEVLESGSHRELMAANGAYAGMYRAFSSGLLPEELS